MVTESRCVILMAVIFRLCP